MLECNFCTLALCTLASSVRVLSILLTLCMSACTLLIFLHHQGVEEENSILIGQVKGLREALEKAQHNSTKHKREAINLTQRVNTLKSSLAQAIAIAEESTLHKLEVAEVILLSSKLLCLISNVSSPDSGMYRGVSLQQSAVLSGVF